MQRWPNGFAEQSNHNPIAATAADRHYVKCLDLTPRSNTENSGIAISWAKAAAQASANIAVGKTSF